LHRTASAVKGTGLAAAIESGVTVSTGPPRKVKVSLCGQPASVPAARQFVRDTLDGCPRADDLALAVTELATNAIAWSASGEDGTFTVTVRAAPRWARIEVTDPGPARQPTAHGNGWGLRIVAAITDRAGTTHGPGRTRTAWAEVTWPAEATPVTAPPGSRHPDTAPVISRT
jgi:serine/threonine-protein kinase RsbW